MSVEPNHSSTVLYPKQSSRTQTYSHCKPPHLPSISLIILHPPLYIRLLFILYFSMLAKQPSFLFPMQLTNTISRIEDLLFHAATLLALLLVTRLNQVRAIRVTLRMGSQAVRIRVLTATAVDGVLGPSGQFNRVGLRLGHWSCGDHGSQEGSDNGEGSKAHCEGWGKRSVCLNCLALMDRRVVNER